MWSITITAGWWLVPLVITVSAFIIAELKTPPNRGGFLSGLEGGFLNLIALVVSLFSWVIYLAIT